MLHENIASLLNDLSKKNSLRQRQLQPSSCHLNFSSNDYLSLAHEPVIKSAYEQGFSRFGTGSGGSMVLGGYQTPHKMLEKSFAQALSVDDCLLFSSGYVANLSVIQLLSQLAQQIIIDKKVHASIYDGIKATNLDFIRFQHNNLGDLAKKVQISSAYTAVITESIFSMSGELAPLAAMCQLLIEKAIPLIVDEAHAFGVIGEEGLGGVVAQQLTQDEIPLRIIPLGKSFAAAGAIVAGKAKWIEALLQCSRAYIYSTAVSPALAWGMRATLEFLRKADDRREHLFNLIAYFRKKIQQSQLTWRTSLTPVQQLQFGSAVRAQDVAEFLGKQGICCYPIRPPTVSFPETGLRIILNYHHSFEDIAFLFECLQRV